MSSTRVASRVCIPIITTVLIVWLLLSAIAYFSPSEPLLPLLVDKTVLHVSNALRIIIDQVDFSWNRSGQSSNKHFLPPAHYERDPRGAIDILERRGYVVCRVYVACRDRSSQILLPLWMRNYANLISEKCALSNFRFVHYSRLQNYPPSPAIYDWLGPQVPAPALRTIIDNPLSQFFSANNATKTKLASSLSLHRSCMAPNESKDKNISICDDDPEPRIARPVVILNIHPDHPFVRNDYYNVLRQAVRNIHAADLVILDPSSDMLARNRVCFRSIVSTPSIDRLTGQTDLNPSEFESMYEQNETISSIVGEALEEADRTIDYALQNDESLGLSSLRAQDPNIGNTSNEKTVKVIDSNSVGCLTSNSTLNCFGVQKNQTSLEQGVNHSFVDGVRKYVVTNTVDNVASQSEAPKITDGLANIRYEASLVISRSQNSSDFIVEQRLNVSSFENSTRFETDQNISKNAKGVLAVGEGTFLEKNNSELIKQNLTKQMNNATTIQNSSLAQSNFSPFASDLLNQSFKVSNALTGNFSHVVNESVMSELASTHAHANVSEETNQFFSSKNRTLYPRTKPFDPNETTIPIQSLRSENITVILTKSVNPTSGKKSNSTDLDTGLLGPLHGEKNTQAIDEGVYNGSSIAPSGEAGGLTQNKSTESPVFATADVDRSSIKIKDGENEIRNKYTKARADIKKDESGDTKSNDSESTSLDIAHDAQTINSTLEVETDSGCDTSMLNDVFDFNDNLSTKFQLFDKLSHGRAPEVARAEVNKRMMDNGGIELFTHRTVDGTYWNNLTPESAQYGICRLYKVCRNSDSTLLLPEWLESYGTLLRQHCGFPRAKFVPNIEFDTMYGKILNESDKLHGFNHVLATTGLKTPHNMEVNLDLIGTRIYRAQEQHFVTDLFQEAIHSLDAVMNFQESNDSTFRRECVYRSSNADNAKAVKCESDSPYKAALRPVFIMNDLVKKRNKATRFIRGLISMVPPRSHEDTRLVFTSDLSQTGKNNATCFRSILLTHDVYPPQSVLQETEHNAFYEQNKLKRDSIINKVGSRRDKSFRSHDDICHIQMTILRPRKVDRKFRQLGKIENEDKVLEEAVRVADAVAARRGLNGMELHITRLLHDNINIAQTARVIQQSEVILGGNNPSMTNIMFARPHTAVIEIQSFGYSTGPYRSFARALNLTYTSIMARPDLPTFEKCVMDKYDKNWENGEQTDEMEARRNGLLRLFREATTSFDGATSTIDLTSLLKQDGSRRRGYIPLERVCARQQRLAVNEEMVGRIVAEQAATICEMKLEAKIRSESSQTMH